MKFRQFVAEQVARLTSFKDFSSLPQEGKKEFVDVLFDLAKEPNPGRDRTALDWLDSAPAQMVRATVTDCSEFEKVPTIADVRSVWNRLFPPASNLRKDCPRCAGEGWVTVDGPYGTSAAYSCTHQPATEADKRMGVRMHPSTAEHYRQLEVEAAPRRAEWVGSGGKVNHKNLQEMFKSKGF